MKNTNTLCSTLGLPLHSKVLFAKPTCIAGKRGWHHPRHSLTGIHSLDSDWRVTADGEAEAFLPPWDGDLGHSSPVTPRSRPKVRKPTGPTPEPSSSPREPEPKRRLASPSPSLSRPRHLGHWVVGQEGRLGAQEANPGQCGRLGWREPWKSKLHLPQPR